MNNIDQQFIEYVVKSLVGKPEAVKVARRIDEKGVLLELTVDPEDLGRVIGKATLYYLGGDRVALLHNPCGPFYGRWVLKTMLVIT